MPLRNRRVTALLVCIAAFAGAVSLSASAGAATIHACVKKTSGVTRIVSAKAKCRRGEQRLSWNAAGSKGATGATGAPGAPGAAGTPGTAGVNGAVAGFAASTIETGPIGVETTVLVSKLLPPGSYIVSGKTEIVASSPKQEPANALCLLLRAAGTTPPVEGEILDESFFGSELTKFTSANFEAAGTLAFFGSYSSKVATTVDVVCSATLAPVKALFTNLTATEVSSLG